jgi:RNA polymerase sigma-70 factor (ECF subfamily)
VSPSEQNQRFESWLREHAAMLHHVAKGFAEGADRHDLMQELLLAVWRAVPAFKQSAQASTFIYRVAHNAALTWKRSQTGLRRRLDRFQALAVPEPAAPHPERHAIEKLYGHIRQLPPLDRSLILLHLDGVSYAAMAEIHGLTEVNVGVRLTRAKQKLSATMKGDHP